MRSPGTWSVLMLTGAALIGCDRAPAVPKPVSTPGAAEVSPPQQGDRAPSRLVDPAPSRTPEQSGVGGTR